MSMPKIFLLTLTACFLLVVTPTFADTLPQSQFDSNGSTASVDAGTNLEAVVTKIEEEKNLEVMGKKQHYQRLELEVTGPKNQGKVITVENGNVPQVNQIRYQPGDKVLVLAQKDPDGNDIYYITDFIRRGALQNLFILFVVLTIVIGGLSGFKSLIGMGFSFFMIFQFILPKIAGGADPVQIILLASLLIIPVTFYLAHGLNKKTTVAIISTFTALILTAWLASFAVSSARLNGYASEEAGFLQASKGGGFNVMGILLAGMIVGAFGLLNDITISQASVVEQLAKTDPGLTFGKLYQKAMSVGKDHIASMVNTLVLVYAGAALPLLLLFINNPHPFSEVINYEIVAEEVVRTLISSSGLILAVPLTNLLACYFFARKPKSHATINQ